MNNKYKKFLTVGLVSVAIGLGATVSQDAEAITMPAVRTSTVATNVAISSSRNAANVAVANATNKNQSKDIDLVFASWAALATLSICVGMILVAEPQLISNAKKKISNVRDKLLGNGEKSEHKPTF